MRLQFDDLLQTIVHIARIPDDIEIVLGVDQIDQPAPNHFVVVDDEDIECHAFSL